MVLAWVPGVFAQSQATTGVIEGIVTDEGGGVLPGATVVCGTPRRTSSRRSSTDARRPLPRRAAAARSLPGHGDARRASPRWCARGSTSASARRSPSTLQLQQSRRSRRRSWSPPRRRSSRRRAPKGRRASTRRRSQDLPNNGRNFLDFTKLTPGVTIVQGPDGDELSINGQKGIYEQRLGRRRRLQQPVLRRAARRPAPAVHLQPRRGEGDGRRRRRRERRVRPLARRASSTSSPSRARTTSHGTRARRTSRTTRSARAPKKPDGTTSRRSSTSNAVPDRLHARRAARARTSSSTSSPLDYQKGRSTKQTDPTRIEQRVVDAFAALGSPNENGPIERTNDARVLPRSRSTGTPSAKHLLTLRYNYTWSEQKNGTFDVDSWGAAPTRSRRTPRTPVTGSLDLDLQLDAAQRVPLPVRRENRPRPYNGPLIAGQSRPLPDTAFDFAQQLPLRRAVLHPGQVLRHARAVQRQRLVPARRARASRRASEFNRVNSVQTFVGFANGRYIFSSTDGFLNYAAESELRRVLGRHAPRRPAPARPGTTITGPVLLYLQQAGVGGLTVEEAGTQSIPQTEPARLRAGQLAADAEPHRPIRPALGGADRARSDHAAEPGLLRAVHRQDVERGQAVPLERQDPVATTRCGSRASASPGIRSGDGKRRRPRQRRHLLRPRPGPDPGLVALDQRQPRPDDLPQQRASPASSDRCPRIRTSSRSRRSARRSTPTSSSSTRTSRTRAPRRRASSYEQEVVDGLRVPGQVQLREGRRTSPASSTATTRSSARRGAPASAPAARTASAC